MKRFFALALALVTLLTLVSCKQSGSFDKEGYRAMFDAAVRLPKEFSRELMDKVIPPQETEYFIDYYANKKQYADGEQKIDYITAIAGQYADMDREYTEVYGEDWKLTYTVVNAEEKDADGLDNYVNSYDKYYFDTYGIDRTKVQAVTFVTVALHIEGSKDFNDREKTLQCFCYEGVWYSFYGAMLPTKM